MITDRTCMLRNCGQVYGDFLKSWFNDISVFLLPLGQRMNQRKASSMFCWVDPLWEIWMNESVHIVHAAGLPHGQPFTLSIILFFCCPIKRLLLLTMLLPWGSVSVCLLLDASSLHWNVPGDLFSFPSAGFSSMPLKQRNLASSRRTCFLELTCAVCYVLPLNVLFPMSHVIL